MPASTANPAPAFYSTTTEARDYTEKRAVMNIDDWVEQSLLNDQKPPNPLLKCEMCADMWHGLRRGSCPGPFSLNVEAIQNQGVVDWTEYGF